MRDVVITGAGLVTPLGNGLEANDLALRQGLSGIKWMSEWAELDLDSQIAGLADEDPECPLIDKKRKRFMTPNSRMAVAAAYEALVAAKLEPEELRHKRIAIIMGCAGSSYQEIYEQADGYIKSGHKLRKVSPFVVPRVMPSSAVANLSLILGITGETFDISSACASSAHAVIVAMRLLESGAYDVIITGGSDELNWTHALGFNAMRALSTKYNDRPTEASRPFDRDRDGFVIAEGAGVLVLETKRHARTRGVEPMAIISGGAANSNATDMVVPSSHSSAEVMKMAILDADLKLEDIGYINTHGTSTPTGDPVELEAIRHLFGAKASKVPISSTKSMTGHMIGATGAVEIVFCAMMMNGKYLAPSINIDNPEPGYEWADLVRQPRAGVEIRHSLSNSFGFGGTNACVIVSRVD